jgi:hypothetical protein
MKHLLLFALLVMGFSCVNGQSLFYISDMLNKADVNLVSALGTNKSLGIAKPLIGDSIRLPLTDSEVTAFSHLSLFLKDPKAFVTSGHKLDLSTITTVLEKYKAKIKDAGQNVTLPFGFTGTSPVGGILASAPNLISGVSGFSTQQESDIYDALSKYIAKQFRQGVVATYMQVFTDVLDKFGELNYFFPTTYELLKNQDPFNFPNFGNDEQNAYNTDLRNLLSNFSSLLDKDKAFVTSHNFKFFTYDTLTKIKAASYYPYLKVGIDIGDKLINKYHPIEIINFLDQKYYQSSSTMGNNKVFDALGDLFHGINILQSSFRDSATNNQKGFTSAWVTIEQVNELLKTPNRLKMFVYLIYLQDPAFFDSFIKEFDNDLQLDKVRDFVRKYFTPAYELLTKIQEFKNDSKVEDKEYTYYMQFTLDLITTVNTGFLPKPIFDADQLYIAQKSLDILKSVQEKNYNNLATNFFLLAGKLVEKSGLSKDQKFLTLMANFSKYAQFMVRIVNAKTSDDMESVITQMVVPANSYIKNRKSNIAIGIGAHPGLFAADEVLMVKKNTTGLTAKPGFNFGITAPVGITVTLGNKSKTKNGIAALNADGTETYTGRAWTLFVQIIDIGAMVNYRLGADSTSTLPQNVTFQQIFSPGFSINRAFWKNSPVNFGIGYQWSPELRSITKDGAQLSANSNRLFLRVSWELPLFNIYKNPKY